MRKTSLMLSALLLIVVIVLHMGIPVFALSDEDKHAIDIDTVWHKVYPLSVCGGGSAGAITPGPLYFVGDSIGTQVQDSLSTALGGKGWQVQANALSGRNLSGTPPAPDGLGAVDQDQAFIKTATAVVVELGTNTGGFSADTVSQMIDKIRTLAPSAAIFWVDTAVVERQDYAQALDSVNSIIYSQSTQKNYQVISWNKKVFGDSADPQNINASAPDNGYIRHADEFVHLTDQGVAAMTDLIASSVSGGGTTGTSSTGCACTPLTGADNAEKIWKFLTGKGLTPVAAAGIMGNLQAESGFNPKRVQNTSTPDGDRDNITVDGVTGYGIAQWTSAGRQQGLADLAASRGVISGDLGVQLDYLWQELTGSYVDVYNQIKDSTDIALVNNVFGHQYEGYGTDSEGLRLDFANSILTQFGSLAGGSTGVSC